MPLTELEQVNAVIGLSMRIEGWPSTLADHGYTLDRIELKFKVPDPQRPGLSIFINPDLLFVADDRNFSLVVELKSGRFRDLEQLNRFVKVTPWELIRYGGVPVRDQAQAAGHQICVAELVNEEFLEEYRSEFVRFNHPASLVSMGRIEIRSHHGLLADSKLDRTLKNGVSVEGRHRPTRIVPVLPTTNDENALISSVVNAVKQLWVNNVRAVTPAEVAKTVFKGLWECFAGEAQRRYLRVAKEVLNDMVETEFYSYLRPVANERDKWALLRLPEKVDDRHRTRHCQQFSSAVRDYQWRRRSGAAYDKRRAAQFSLEDVSGYSPESDG
jgi:hypothetical protein